MTAFPIEARRPRRLLDRILETPNLPRVVQSLEPRVLSRLVRRCGLEDAGEIVTLATTEQLMRIFDDDLWRSDEAGTTRVTSEFEFISENRQIEWVRDFVEALPSRLIG